MDKLHPYLEKSPKEIIVGLTVNGLQPVYEGLGAQRPSPLIGLKDNLFYSPPRIQNMAFLSVHMSVWHTFVMFQKKRSRDCKYLFV